MASSNLISDVLYKENAIPVPLKGILIVRCAQLGMGVFKEIPPQQCSVQMVANGKAVNLFRKDKATKYANEMEDLHKRGVRFKACRNAMIKNNIQKADLLEICDVVPAGILELIDLQRQGFAYIKP